MAATEHALPLLSSESSRRPCVYKALTREISTCETEYARHRMRRVALQYVLGIAFLFRALFTTELPAHAAVTIEGGPLAFWASIDAYLACVRVRPDPESEELCAAFGVATDPIGSISRYMFTMNYDPTRIHVNLTNTRFLCDFSNDGDCPPLEGPDHIIKGPPLHVGGPRAGSTFSFLVDPLAGTLSLVCDMSRNPASSEAERNVFMIGIDILGPWSGQVTVSDQPGICDMYFTSGSCIATVENRLASCDTSNRAVGIDFVVPEPPAGMFVAGGIGGLILLFLRRVPLARVSPSS